MYLKHSTQDSLDQSIEKLLKQSFYLNIEEKKVRIKTKNTAVLRQNRKQEIFNRIEDIFERINEELDIQREDDVIKNLILMKKTVAQEQFNEMTEVLRSGIGKRLYNIQAQKLKLRGKKMKVLHDQFKKSSRTLAILQYPYYQLQDQMYIQKKFLFIPYSSGRGFNYSSSRYGNIHKQTLQQIEAQNVLKTINQFYFNPKRQIHKNINKVVPFLEVFKNILKIIIIVCLVFLFFVGTQFATSTQYVINTTFTPSMLILLFIWMIVLQSQTSDVIDQKSTFKQYYELIFDYFEELNQKSEQNFIKYQWNVCKKLLWISVKVDKMLQTQKQQFIQQRRRR